MTNTAFDTATKIRRAAAAALFAALFFAATSVGTAAAQESAIRIVRLHDGSIYRGVLVEQVPNDHITLSLATGELKRFEWRDLEGSPQIEVPAPIGVPVMPVTPVTSAPTLGDASGGTVSVNMESNRRNAGLHRVSGVGEVRAWTGTVVGSMTQLQLLCLSPCGVQVDPRWQFRIAGEGITPSNLFSLPSDQGPLRLRVKAGSQSARTAGKLLSLSGGGLAVGGGVILGMGALFARAETTNGASSGSANVLLASGGVLLGVGAGMLITGIILWATSGTSVDISAEGTPRLSLGGGASLTPQGIAF